MTWNWQQHDWPEFVWDPTRLAKAEQRFLIGAGIFLGSVNHLGAEDQRQLTIEAISNEAMTTSEIEGEILDRASVQSSIKKQFGLTSDDRRIEPRELGISEMMVDLYRTSGTLLTSEMLFSWQRMLTSDRRGMRDIGSYRTGVEPMQVVSGMHDNLRVHFEAPPYERVPFEMNRFIDWFNKTHPKSGEPLPALTRAGISHLYFECIHPFEDGNGRIGRAIAEKSLSQSVEQPSLIALASTIMIRRKGYYDALEFANKSNEITEWLAWFAGIALEAQQRTSSFVEFIIEKAKLLDGLSGKLHNRQRKVLLRMFQEGPQGFKGGLSARNYMTIAGASPATATRDLVDLVDQGALTRYGELRYARYHLAIPLKQSKRIVIDNNGEVIETEQGM